MVLRDYKLLEKNEKSSKCFTFFYHILAFAQDTIYLDSRYYVSTNFDYKENESIKINEYVNYDLYLKYQDAILSKKYLSSRDKNLALETKAFIPTEGNYMLNNNTNNSKLYFSIDNQGRFTGEAHGEFTDFKFEKKLYKYHFTNGKISDLEIKDKYQELLEYYHRNDSTLVIKRFYPNKHVRDTRLFKLDNTYIIVELTLYVTNGNINKQEDFINKIVKEFNENGSPKFYRDYKNDNETISDAFGNTVKNIYGADGEICYELYEKNIN